MSPCCELTGLGVAGIALCSVPSLLKALELSQISGPIIHHHPSASVQTFSMEVGRPAFAGEISQWGSQSSSSARKLGGRRMTVGAVARGQLPKCPPQPVVNQLRECER